ncbi:MAG TPA: DUF805 domain-containing protein [Bauldia sp.]|nr:DUF805 domain-containing protein [Bauldia sp.]
MDFAYILTSTQGRIPRSQWWAGLVILVVIGLVLGFIINWVFGLTTIGLIAILILQIILLYPSYCISAKRFQDRNKPGTLALIGIGLAILQTLARLVGLSNPFNPTAVDWILNIALLIVGIWYLIELGILRGTIGPNTYGPDPLEGRP